MTTTPSVGRRTGNMTFVTKSTGKTLTVWKRGRLNARHGAIKATRPKKKKKKVTVCLYREKRTKKIRQTLQRRKNNCDQVRENFQTDVFSLRRRVSLWLRVFIFYFFSSFSLKAAKTPADASEEERLQRDSKQTPSSHLSCGWNCHQTSRFLWNWVLAVSVETLPINTGRLQRKTNH